MTARIARQMEFAKRHEPSDIAFIAISQAHQFLHWLPAALRLASEPGIRVTVLVSSEAGEQFIRSFDPDGRLSIKRLRTITFRKHGLFNPPMRGLALLLNALTIERYPILVTTETTSSFLRWLPGFRSKMIHLKHGAGDREGGYNSKHAHYDLTLVNGPKDKQRLIERGLGTEDNIRVVGYGKFELVRTQPAPLFDNGRPLALYNPHFDSKVDTWARHGRDVVRTMESIPDWNFVAAPHVKLRGGPNIRSRAENVMIDRGSIRSIDMTYTQAADVYIGDVSSQVYEFIRTPRPCIFLNLDGIDWRANPAYSHWHLGQVIDRLEELQAALARAHEIQPQFEELQRKMSAASIDQTEVPASQRQAEAILEFARTIRD
ncbi:MAG: glycosyl transferase [Sphingomicrobium sp.]